MEEVSFIIKTMEWTNDQVFRLIELYKERPCLWDNNHTYFKILSKKNECFREMAEELGVDSDEIRKKLNSLLASFRRERSKVKSLWFAFDKMRFLLDKYYARNPSYVERSLLTIRKQTEMSNLQGDRSYGQDGQVSYIMSEPSTSSFQSNYGNQKQSLAAAQLSSGDQELDEQNGKKSPSLHNNKFSKRKKIDGKRRKTYSSKKIKKKKSSTEFLMEKVEKILDSGENYDDIFGINAANELKNLNEETKILTKKLIMELLFEAQLGRVNRKTRILYDDDSFDDDITKLMKCN